MILGGQPATGAAVAALKRDLSHRGGVYRFSITCPPHRHAATVSIYLGEFDGTVTRFWTARAEFVGRELVAYSSLQPTNAESFWWR